MNVPPLDVCLALVLGREKGSFGPGDPASEIKGRGDPSVNATSSLIEKTPRFAGVPWLTQGTQLGTLPPRWALFSGAKLPWSPRSQVELNPWL